MSQKNKYFLNCETDTKVQSSHEFTTFSRNIMTLFSYSGPNTPSYLMDLFENLKKKKVGKVKGALCSFAEEASTNSLSTLNH